MVIDLKDRAKLRRTARRKNRLSKPEGRDAPASPESGARAARPATATAAEGRAVRTRRRWPPLSPLTLRILAVNVLALAILGGGLMYLDVYRAGLIDTEIAALTTKGEIIAGALGEGAVRGGGTAKSRLVPERVRALVRRLVPGSRTRARVFAADGALLVDSQTSRGPRGFVRVEELPPPRSRDFIGNAIVDVYDWFVSLLEYKENFPRYHESAVQRITDYEEAIKARRGEEASAVRIQDRGLLVTSVALPVQQYKKVVGVLLLSSATGDIEQNLRTVRLRILQIFAIVLAITVLMSLYLARTIARPITRLAAAAEQVRRGRGREIEIPDFTRRRDEIGDLSGALREMTATLWRRMDAIERFAADVAHEIKNPLSSLRSAVETAARVEDKERQRALMRIILEDVERLDRLISDISHASRLDSQLSRHEWAPVDVEQLLATLVSVHQATLDSRATRRAKRLKLAASPGGAYRVLGNEDQLVQVFRNIINNGLSFSPPGSVLTVSVARDGNDVVASVEDQGPGIPEDNLESIFNRFYTERPVGERFGTHSGLGLSISRQIVEAHGGTVRAENRRDPEGKIVGARFVVRLPALDG